MYQAAKRSQLCDYILQLDDHKFGKIYNLLLSNASIQRAYSTDDFNIATLEAIKEVEENKHQLKRYTSAKDMMIEILGPDY